MSRGLGRLQRDILSTLDLAQEWHHSYRGYDSYYEEYVVRGAHVKIGAGIYDLRAIARVLATRYGALASRAFQASFSRAVYGLVKAGYLAPVSLLPVTGGYQIREWLLHRLSDGDFILLGTRQVRFVRRGSKCCPSTVNAYDGLGARSDRADGASGEGADDGAGGCGDGLRSTLEGQVVDSKEFLGPAQTEKAEQVDGHRGPGSHQG